MEDILKQSVRTLTTSKQICDRLEANYLHTDITSQVANLKYKLIIMNMNENSDVDMFVKNWRLRLDDAILSGLSLPSYIQSALPPSWQQFISTKSTLANISVPKLVASISQENILRRAINQPSSSHTALYIKHPKYNTKPYNKPRSTYQSTNSKFYSRTSNLMIQEIIKNVLSSLNRFAKIVNGVDMKQKIVIEILITKGKEYIISQ